MKNFLLSLLLAGCYLGVSAPVAAFNVNELVTPVTALNYPSTSTMLGISYSDLARLNLASAQSAKLQMLIPPGASIVSLRIESNQWIEGPVMATFAGEVPLPCPTLAGPGAYKCGETLLQPAPGGFSSIIYRSTPLAEATYMYFVIQTTGGYFRFGSMTTSIQITDLAAYKAWVDSGRPVPGGVGGGDWVTCADGTVVPAGSTCPPVVIPDSGFETCADGTLVPAGTPCPNTPNPRDIPVCDALAQRTTPTVGADLSVNIDGLTTSFPGFGVLKVKLRNEYQVGSKIFFSVDLSSATDFQILCPDPVN